VSIVKKTLSLFLCFSFVHGFFQEVVVEANKINLPKIVGDWSRPKSPKIIDSSNIFKYMNGAGELYLGYRFNHLEVFDYTSEKKDDILVELYFMETPDDAFGLLSLDWGGEPVDLNHSSKNKTTYSVAPLSKALYGGGLLRILSDNLYARIMAFRETPSSKQVVLALGKAITANRKTLPEPKLLKALSPHIASAWKLRRDRLSFFRSYLVLNSIYYLSHEDILDLDLSTEAVIAPYEQASNSGDQKRCQFLLVKYKNYERAKKALDHFHKAYLPEYKKKLPPDSDSSGLSLFKLEDGWLGYKLMGKYVAIVFECPDRKSAGTIIENNKNGVHFLESSKSR
jgi:hypothetical protein